MATLFDPFTLKGVTLRNRIVAAPMCMYSATDGIISEWHHAHLAQLAAGGAGLVTVEMSAVSPERPHHLGRCRPVERRRAGGGAETRGRGDQGGRRGPLRPARPRRSQGEREPPVGGRRPYRRRRASWSTESIKLIKLFKQAGLDFVSVSIGFSTVDAAIPWGPAFMAPVVARVRRETGLPVAIAWGLGVPELADKAVRDGQADLVKVERALLAIRTGPTRPRQRSA